MASLGGPGLRNGYGRPFDATCTRKRDSSFPSPSSGRATALPRPKNTSQLYLRFWPRGAERREEILGPLWCLRADFGRRGAPPSGFWAARSGARWILGTSCHGEGWWWSINQLEADAWLVGARRLQAACMEPGRRSGSSSGSQSEGPAPAGASSRRPAKETKARLRVGCWPCWRLCWLLAAQGCC